MFQLKCGADEDNQEEPFNFQALERALKKGLAKVSQPPPLPLAARRVSLPVIPASGSQAKAPISRDPFLALKDDKAAKIPPSTKEESHGEPIYLECEPSTVPASAPSRGLPCSPPASSLKPPKSKILPPGAQPDSDMENKPWYAGSCDRHTAEATLLQFNKDSAYLVRRSSRHGWNQPFTLAVFYKNHVYNIPIRYLEGTSQYMLGKDGKTHKELFNSIPSIIQNYTERPLVLIDGNTSAKEQTCLLFPVKP
ncbi:SH2 domain-containing protein 6 isoform X1 [Pogona vitticeps]